MDEEEHRDRAQGVPLEALHHELGLKGLGFRNTGFRVY